MGAFFVRVQQKSKNELIEQIYLTEFFKFRLKTQEILHASNSSHECDEYKMDKHLISKYLDTMAGVILISHKRH